MRERRRADYLGKVRTAQLTFYTFCRQIWLKYTMATDTSLDHDHHVYKDDKDLPFTYDGNYAFIGEKVERVKRVSGSADNMLYARKTITIEEPDKRALLQEARILHRARHGHVVKLIMTYFFEPAQHTFFAIIMERADGNLDAYLTGKMSRKKTGSLSRWFGCLAGVVAYIHGLGIRHRDIKPTNILIKDEQVLLTDFGISKMGLGKTMPTTVPAFPRARTEGYCAPEVEAGSTRGRSADIFSLGAVFLEMLIAYSYPDLRQDLEEVLTSRGNRSYAKAVDLVHQLMDDIEERGPEKWSLKVLTYCRRMLHEERDQRPLADELDSTWSCLLPADKPLVPCRCAVVVATTQDDEIVGLCKKGSFHELQTLLDSGANSNAVGAIHQASARGFAEIVQLFLDRRVNVNLQDYSQQTPLHCAAGYGYQDIVGMLLRKDANVDVRDDEGQTALHYAAGQGHLCIVEMLMGRGADVQATNDEGRTPLHMAARRGHEKVVRLLVEETANTKTADFQGRTALHFAAGYGSEEVVRRLMETLINDTIDSQDEYGQTALHFAIRGRRVGGKYNAVRKLLKDTEANHQSR
jgi:serine/threonine protein kinase